MLKLSSLSLEFAERESSLVESVTPFRAARTDPTVSVVMPALDEEAGIADCIERVQRGLDELGLPGEVIVSDSSTDNTPQIARSMGAKVVHPDGRGYGYAYKYGFQQARGDYIVMGDADASYDFTELPRLLEPVMNGDADMVLGSRFAGTIDPGAMPALHQYVGNPLLTRLLNVLYGTNVTDAHSGFRVFTTDALEVMDLSSDGMEFASEMLVEAHKQSLRITEVPIHYHRRKGETKLESFHDGWRHIKYLFSRVPDYYGLGSDADQEELSIRQ